MFSSFNYQGSNYGSPMRSDASPSRDRSMDPSRSMSPTNSVASGISSCSAVSNGVKSRQIRDLKMELEMRDERVRELEEAYEELERKAAFSTGEMNCKLAEQQTLVRRMEDKQTELQGTIEAQRVQMQEVLTSLQQYQSIQEMMKTMMERCQELEAQKREQDEKLRKADAERMKAEEEAKAKADADAAEAAASEAAAAAATAEAPAPVTTAVEPRHLVVADDRLAAPRGGRLASARPSSASVSRPGNKKDCSIM
jgi:hypothetical protein